MQTQQPHVLLSYELIKKIHRQRARICPVASGTQTCML
uniref:Uncharacterized protein n=1 Tax=Anguilla anguilla TaxID=7936 RepID=A0A0E9T2J0_ANGAN